MRSFFREIGHEVEAIGFPYINAGKPYAWKLRAIGTKAFTQLGNAATFWSADASNPPEPQPAGAFVGRVKSGLVIVEGEIDALACAASGIHAVSIPNGAVVQVSDHPHEHDPKFRYLIHAKVMIEQADRIVLAVDNDPPGNAVAEELARRIGKGRCLRVEFPAGCKDINDVLIQHGPEVVNQVIKGAKPYPIVGLHTASDFSTHLGSLYVSGLRGGESTGWGNVDRIMTIQPGLLYVVTGIPGSGKSTFIDAMLTNMRDTKHIYASFENPIPLHMAKLCALHHKKAFGNSYNNRMSAGEMLTAMEAINDRFFFLSNDEVPSLKSILDRAKAAIQRYGAKTLTIDPVNYIRMQGDKDGEIIDGMLAELKLFAMSNDVALFLVAHPKKPQIEQKNYIPTGYSISGSASWYNRADIGLTIHRIENTTRAIVWKSRWSHLAQLGDAHLDFDPSTGCFSEGEDPLAF